MNGWIKLDRKITSFSWYDDAKTLKLAIHIILHANFKPNKWQGIQIERGQFVTSYNSLAAAVNMSVQEVRTRIARLKECQFLTHKVTNHYSVITICKYDSYQSPGDEANTPINTQLTRNQQQLKKGRKNKKGKQIFSGRSGLQNSLEVQEQFGLLKPSLRKAEERRAGHG